MSRVIGKELIDSYVCTIRIYYYLDDKFFPNLITNTIKKTKTLKMKIINVHKDCTDIISALIQCSETYNYLSLVDKIRCKKFIQKWIGYNIQHYQVNNWFSTLQSEQIKKIQEKFMSNAELNLEYLIILAEIFTIDIILIENNNFTLIGNGENECICLAKFNKYYFHVILETSLNSKQIYEFLQKSSIIHLNGDVTKYFIDDQIKFEEDQDLVDKNLDYNYYKMLEDYIEWQKRNT